MSADGTGRGLVEFWGWAVKKGLVNANTGGAFRTSCQKILEVQDDWEGVDLKKLNVEQALRQFENLRKMEFTPGSLSTYMRRFKIGLSSYLEYLKDAGSWKAPGDGEKPSAKGSKSPSAEVATSRVSPIAIEDRLGVLVEYPYPLREGLTVKLTLPRDLKSVEVKKLTAYMMTLTSDFDPEA